jgi:quercetin dioxygenase-like cupin family protein
MMRAGTAWVGVCAAATAVAGILVSGQVTAVVPVEQEPQHRPVFRNEAVAVLDVRLPPGYVSLFHTHAHDNVSVRITTGPLRIDTLSGAGTPQTAAVGRVVFNSASPPYTHRVANVGTSLIHILDVEVLAEQPTPRAAVADDRGGHETIAENDRVRLSRIVVPPGGTLPAHTHPRGRLEVVVRGAAPGAYVWRDAGGASPAIEAGASPVELVEIEIK